MKKNMVMLFIYISLSANLMVLLTWIITNALGYEVISSMYLFKNIIAGIAITVVSTIFGWFYSRINHLFKYGCLHFMITAATFIVVGIWANWFLADWKIFLTSALIFVLLFSIIWLMHYLYWRNEIKKINEKLSCS